jgi:hypothetical protein
MSTTTRKNQAKSIIRPSVALQHDTQPPTLFTQAEAEAFLGPGPAPRAFDAWRAQDALAPEALERAHADAREAAEERAPLPPVLDLRWYERSKRSRPELFGPLAVMHLAAVLAHPGRAVRVETLYAHAPRIIVDNAISMLKTSGMVMCDGVTFTITKMPWEGA